MLSLIKSLTKRQKRGIMLSLDSVLIVISVLFALAALGLPGGLIANLPLYFPVLPYVLIIGVGVSIWLGVCSIQLNAYETAAVGMTAVYALFLAITSTIISNIAGLGFPLALHLVFGVVFFASVVVSRAGPGHISPICAALSGVDLWCRYNGNPTGFGPAQSRKYRTGGVCGR